MRTALSFAFVVTLALANVAGAQGHRRLVGKVVDQQGTPVVGAKVMVTSPELRTFESKADTDKDGDFTILVIYRKVENIEARVEAEGYAISETTFALDWGGNNTTKRTIQMISQAVLDEAERARIAAQASDTHNEAVELATAGDWAGAASKFEEALTQGEEQAVTHAGLATASWNLEDYARAEKHARRALQIDAGAPDMKELLAEALSKQGREDEAEVIRNQIAEVNPKMKAELAFNRGADQYNNGQHKEAVSAFEDALAADPELVDAHYALAMAAVAMGDNAKAIEHFNIYVERVPEGEKSDTARSVAAALSKS